MNLGAEREIDEKVQVGKGQENSHSKNQGGKKQIDT